MSITTATAANLPQLMFPQPFIDHPRCTTNTSIDAQCFYRAVKGACPALHAGIPVSQDSLLVSYGEHLMGTDFQAPAATDAGLPVKGQGNNII